MEFFVQLSTWFRAYWRALRPIRLTPPWALWWGYFLALCLNCTACSSAAPPTAAPSSQPQFTLHSQLSHVGGDTLEYATVRVPKPRATLVFENGLMLELTTWQAVAQGLNNCCDLLFYNRPGVGQSRTEHTSLTPELAADRLQRLLQQQHMAPPYLLVGHSLGGQYAQVFASRYPAQVSALLLVDALPLGVVKPAEQFPWYTRAALWAGASAATRDEIATIHAMGNYVLQQRPALQTPMIRLITQSATPQPPSAGLLKNLFNGVVYAEDFGVWALPPDEAEQGMNAIYPQAEVRTIVANHRVQEQFPVAVVDAIESLMQRH